MDQALAAAHQGGEPGDESYLGLMGAAKRMSEACEKKLNRIHARFLQKQGQLSNRLCRRVQRMQLDAEETRDVKLATLLPSIVAAGAETERRAANGEQYLRRHRKLAERRRLWHHGVYLSQVDQFQCYLRLVADPKRAPERGEVFLSEAFRHVLAAGLTVDDHYFFRVLDHLAREDFSNAPTVNLLAACCVAFGVDLMKYREYLLARKLPLMVPKPCATAVQSWQEGTAWAGVDLREHVTGSQTSLPGAVPSSPAGADAVPHLVEDPMPFGPIVPDETPSESALASRDDRALCKILAETRVDDVLERYAFRPSPQEDVNADEGPRAAKMHVRWGTSASPVPEIPCSPAEIPKPASDPLLGRPTAPPKSLVKRASTVSTLEKMRGLNRPLAEQAQVRQGGRQRRERPQVTSSMAPISERPWLEAGEVGAA